MKKKSQRKLSLSRETIRNLVPEELHQVAGGISCGPLSACDCSTDPGDTSVTSAYCTKPQR